MNCDYYLETRFKPMERMYPFLDICGKMLSFNFILHNFYRGHKTNIVFFLKYVTKKIYFSTYESKL